PSLPSLIRRWHECGAPRDRVQLWREIQALGDTHSARTVCRCSTRLRRAREAGQALQAQASPYTRPQGPSARAVSLARVCPTPKRSADAPRYLDQRSQPEASLARAHTLSQAFLAIVRERRGEDLEAWMAAATHSGSGELARV